MDDGSNDIETICRHQRDDDISENSVAKEIAQSEATCLFLQVLYALDDKEDRSKLRRSHVSLLLTEAAQKDASVPSCTQ